MNCRVGILRHILHFDAPWSESVIQFFDQLRRQRAESLHAIHVSQLQMSPVILCKRLARKENYRICSPAPFGVVKINDGVQHRPIAWRTGRKSSYVYQKRDANWTMPNENRVRAVVHCVSLRVWLRHAFWPVSFSRNMRAFFASAARAVRSPFSRHSTMSGPRVNPPFLRLAMTALKFTMPVPGVSATSPP